MALNSGKFSVSWADEDELAGDEMQSTTENGSSPPPPLSDSENGADQEQNHESFDINCVEEQNKEPFPVCEGVEEELSPMPAQVEEEEQESGVEKMPPSPPPLPLSPESKNEVVVLEDEWPSLPPRRSMQGMSPLPSLPPSSVAKSGGGWMQLFAKNNENSTDSSAVLLALPSQRRSSIKKTPPSNALNALYSTMKQQNRDRMVPPQLLAKIGHDSIEKTPSPPPIQIEELDKKLVQPLYPDKKRNINEKQTVQETFRNPFSLLADMENEDSTPQEVVKKSPSIQISKRPKRPKSKSLDKGDDQKQTSSFFITTLLLFMVPFFLVLLTSSKIDFY